MYATAPPASRLHRKKRKNHNYYHTTPLSKTVTYYHNAVAMLEKAPNKCLLVRLAKPICFALDDGARKMLLLFWVSFVCVTTKFWYRDRTVIVPAPFAHA
jgi:hypothetical protein